MKKPWQVETERYIPRLSSCLRELDKTAAFLKVLPTAPLDFKPTPEQQVTLQLVFFCVGAVKCVDQLIDNTGELWSQGRMVGVSAFVRLSLEFWGTVTFARLILENYAQTKDIDKAAEECNRLTVNSRTPITLPWGEKSDTAAYSVMKFIDVLEKRDVGIRGEYEFLCEASHPNVMQNFYFLMASKVYDNFENAVFKKHAHELLDRTTTVAERVTKGLAIDIAAIMDIATQILPKR
jgi:hypothetical protein